jgi:hypothetical protein
MKGGIFMGSSIDNSCKVWNNKIENCRDLGDCEHLIDKLGEGVVLNKNTLYWITDKTPHESLLLNKSYFRQFFRLVSKDIGVWFAFNSTKNPLGVSAKCEIKYESKFI